MTKRILALAVILALFLTPIAFAASGSTKFPFFAKQRARGIELVPNTATDVTSTDSTVFQITAVNKTGTAATLLVQDRQGTPRTLIPTVSIPGNTVFVAAFPEGVYMTSGVTWTAGTANAIEAEILVFYK